ncbi:MerR family transcriptional regulator [Mycetocola tolaasinivorans]|uniref:MerR family transcriptional regulator n=1 Tax=Mycetocola tolaasinivorans TaxID=76635 RepID=A0A3L7A332_9MICO|nr:MerR family transcriptional regulator [Mycetocola tolaasinivorans]RLP74494.1 MerR family transcriptional regulator [Mycetocola tolaasinivorans]
MYIGELATRTATSPRLLRYYEKQGLLPAGRDVNGYRLYADSAIHTVETIRCLLDAGVPTRLILLLLPEVEPGQEVLDIPLDPAIRLELEGYRQRLYDRHILVAASLTAIDNYLARARARSACTADA